MKVNIIEMQRQPIMSRLSQILCVALLCNAFDASAFEAYNHNSTISTSNPSWMSRLKDSARLRELSIPGTHDSVALHDTQYHVTQTLDLSKQLNAGIRFLDIRLKCVNDELRGFHAGGDQKINFDQILNSVDDFLRANPREVVFARIKNEQGIYKADQPCQSSTGRFKGKSFYDAFNSYFQAKNLFWKQASLYQTDDGHGQYNPPLSAMRGKLVLFPEFSNAEGVAIGNEFGIRYEGSIASTPHFKIQDHWSLSVIHDLHDQKWERVKRHLVDARGQDTLPMQDRWVYFNWQIQSRSATRFRDS